MREGLAAVLLTGSLAFVSAEARPAVDPVAHPSSIIRTPSVSIEPAVVELDAGAGTSFLREISVRNGTPFELQFNVVVEDVLVHGGKRLFRPAGESRGSIAATVVVDPAALVLQPGQSGRVSVLITIPHETAIRAVAIFFRSRTNDASARGPAISLNIGALVTLRLSGKPDLFSGPVLLREEGSRISLVQTLTNRGSELLIAKGTFALVGEGGELHTLVHLPPTRLLPGETTNLEAESPRALPPGRYRAISTFASDERLVVREASMQLGEPK
ncbi:MAG TPA: hypothetical protein VMT00_00625 [Thermoanaerobaculia bacterium]|nr:hypothetical protein [Thermoanaerobaculia bacterium]